MRKKKGVSQEELAKLLGVTKSTISKYELGHREISIEQLKMILDFFGVEYGLFLTDFDDPNATEWNDHVLDAFFKTLFPEDPSEGERTAEPKAMPLLGPTNTPSTSEIEALFAPGTLSLSLLLAFGKLNPDGQQKAVERVEELTEIPKYQKKPPQD